MIKSLEIRICNVNDDDIETKAISPEREREFLAQVPPQGPFRDQAVQIIALQREAMAIQTAIEDGHRRLGEIHTECYRSIRDWGLAREKNLRTVRRAHKVAECTRCEKEVKANHRRLLWLDWYSTFGGEIEHTDEGRQLHLACPKCFRRCLKEWGEKEAASWFNGKQHAFRARRSKGGYEYYVALKKQWIKLPLNIKIHDPHWFDRREKNPTRIPPEVTQRWQLLPEITFPGWF